MEKCPITELPAEEIDRFIAGTCYKIKYEKDTYIIGLGLSFDYFSKQDYFIKNKYLLAGGILTNQLMDKGDAKVFTLSETDWQDKISKVIYPKAPKDKLDNLFKSLYSLQNYDGEEVEIFNILNNPGFWYKHFFKSRSECCYYLRTLDNAGLIKGQFQEHTGLLVEYYITFKGLNYYLDTLDSGNLSKKCFVAMSFGKEMDDIRNVIKEALKYTGYEPIIIDEEHIDSDKTINDAIIAGLKSAKFCIADYTEQKHGVYFESGFALGQGKPIIYCCRNDYFDNTHFDTKHFAHIIYENPEELRKRLIDKINAWIK